MLSAESPPTLPVCRDNQPVVAPKNTLGDWHKALRSRWVALWYRRYQWEGGSAGWTGLTLVLQVGSGTQLSTYNFIEKDQDGTALDVSLEVQGSNSDSIKEPDKRK